MPDLNGATIGGWSAFASVILTAFGWILRNIVASIVRKEMAEQSRWIRLEFKKIKNAIDSHVSKYHGNETGK